MPDFSRGQKWFLYGLLFWIFTQVSRFVAIPLLQAIADGDDPEAWFYPASLDIFAAVLAIPVMALIYWRRGFASWLITVIYLVISIVDHIGNFFTTWRVGPPPTLAESSPGPPELVPAIQTFFDVVFVVLLLMPVFRMLFFQLTTDDDVRPAQA